MTQINATSIKRGVPAIRVNRSMPAVGKWLFALFLASIMTVFHTAMDLSLSTSPSLSLSLSSEHGNLPSSKSRAPGGGWMVFDRSEETTHRNGNHNPADHGACQKFDPGDPTPLSPNTPSIFNCGSSSGTCHWFYPSRFFHPTCGTGKAFLPQLQHMQSLYASGKLWNGGPPIVLPTVSIVPEHMKVNPFRDGPWPKHNISMVHVHKTAGTSLVIAFSRILKRGAVGQRRTIYLPKEVVADGAAYPAAGGGGASASASAASSSLRRGARSAKYTPAYDETSEVVSHAVKYRAPDDWGPDDHTIFAVVRDPVDRFVSAIGQATGAYGSTKNGVGKQLLDACLRPTSKQTLNCFIDLMHTNSTWIEVHFTPMLLEISFATFYRDVPVAIFPFEEVPNLLMELGADPKKKRKDGAAKDYRKHEVLTKMSVEDYDDDMLKKLCRVYKMDAMLMIQLGYATKCEKFMTVL